MLNKVFRRSTQARLCTGTHWRHLCRAARGGDGGRRFEQLKGAAPELVKRREPGSPEDVGLERYEMKYIIHPSQVHGIREFIKPFTVADPNAGVDPPEYDVVTLQLDSPDLALFKAKEYDAINRFKLRIRTYVSDEPGPVFLEIKRKIKGVVVKSRARIPMDAWHNAILAKPGEPLNFRSDEEDANYLQFLRLVHEIGTRPTVRIRYTRESYLGLNDRYARLTIDRNLAYQPTTSWDFDDLSGNWWAMDSTMAMNRPFSGVILELKTFQDAPLWMIDLTERFNLERVGFCKYFTAMRLDSLFRGELYSDASDDCNYG